MTIYTSALSKADYIKMYTVPMRNYNKGLKLDIVSYTAASIGAHNYLNLIATGQLVSPILVDDNEVLTMISHGIKGKAPIASSIEKIKDEYRHVEVDYPNHYVYLGDIAGFSATFFSGVIPSIAKSILEYMSFKKIINVAGSSAKRFLIIKPYDFSDADVNAINQKIISYSEQNYSTLSDAVKNYMAITDQTISNYKLDQEYLVHMIDSLSKRVVDLEQALETQQKEGINGYLLSWH